MKVERYTVELVALKVINVPPDTVISPTAKSVVALLEVKINVNESSLEVSPSLAGNAVMVMVGGKLVVVQLNMLDAPLLLPDASVNLFARTFMVHAPSAVGVKVAV